MKKRNLLKNFFPGKIKQKGNSKHNNGLLWSWGFTLIESIVYISILSIIIVVVINTALFSISAFGKSRISRNVSSQGGAALERMLREIRLANGIVVAASTFGVNPGVLRLNTVVSSSDLTATTREFSLVASTTMLQEGASAATSLTTGVEVTNLTFYSITNASPRESVRVEMTVKDSSGHFEAVQIFYGTAVLRGGY